MAIEFIVPLNMADSLICIFYTNVSSNKSCRYTKESIICTCISLHMVEPTVANAGWWMTASYF